MGKLFDDLKNAASTILLIVLFIIVLGLMFIVCKGLTLFIPVLGQFLIWFSIISFIIYRNYLKKPKKFKEVIRRVEGFEAFSKFDKALDMLNDALKLEGLQEDEKAQLYIKIAYIYRDKKDYVLSAKYFDKAFDIGFEANKVPKIKKAAFEQIIRVYDEAGRRDNIIRIYKKLLAMDVCPQIDGLE